MIDEIARHSAATIRVEAAKIAASLDRPEWLDSVAVDGVRRVEVVSATQRLRPACDRQLVRRRRLVGIALASLLVVVGGVFIVRLSSEHRSPANIRPSNTNRTETSAPAPGSTEPEPTSPSTGDTATSLSAFVDLSGTEAGLVIAPEALPNGWYPINAGPVGPDSGSGDMGVRWETWSGRYKPDRAGLDEVLTVVVNVGVADVTPPDSRITDVRSTTGHLTSRSLDWVENGSTVILQASLARTDLVAIAEALTLRPDGAFDFGQLPAGFEQIAVTPGTASFGTGFYTAYASAQSVDGDGAVLTVSAWVGSSTPAEVKLASFHGSASASAYATEINGRRAIVQPGLAPTVVWDESDGTQISVEYVPLEGDGTVADRAQTAIVLASALRRASTPQWADIVSEVPANAAAFSSTAYMTDQLLPMDLTLAGPAVRLYGKRSYFLVPVRDSVGRDAGSCEFFLRQLVACATPAQQTELPRNSFRATDIGNGYIRLVAGPASTQAVLSFQDTRVTSSAVLTPYSASSTSAGVAYLAVRGDPTTMCLSFEDANGPVSMAADASVNAVPACPTNQAAISPASSGGQES